MIFNLIHKPKSWGKLSSTLKKKCSRKKVFFFLYFPVYHKKIHKKKKPNTLPHTSTTPTQLPVPTNQAMTIAVATHPRKNWSSPLFGAIAAHDSTTKTIIGSQQSKISPQIHASLHSHCKQQQQRIRLYATEGTHNNFQGKLINSCHVTTQVSSLVPHQRHVTSAHHTSAAQLRATSAPYHPTCYSFCHLNNYGVSFLPS